MLCTTVPLLRRKQSFRTCRFEVLQTDRFAVLRTLDDYRVRPTSRLGLPPPEFEGTATAVLLGGTGSIASWLKMSLCMIDQVLLVGHVKYRFHPPLT